MNRARNRRRQRGPARFESNASASARVLRVLALLEADANLDVTHERLRDDAGRAWICAEALGRAVGLDGETRGRVLRFMRAQRLVRVRDLRTALTPRRAFVALTDDGRAAVGFVLEGAA